MYEGQSETKKSNIKRAEEGLYSREHVDSPIVGTLKEKKYDVRDNWMGEDSKKTKKMNTYTRKRNSIVKTIFIISSVFLIGAASLAFYVLYGGINDASPENINMSIVGPVSVDAGEKVDLQVLIENKNTSNLLSAELFIDLPGGAKATMGDQENVTRIIKSLGTITPNELINEKFSAVFFGEENKEKKILVTLEYRFEGSNATLVKKIEHSVLIVSSQVGFTLETLSEASSGQEIDVVISVDSSTSETLEGLMFEITYPFGFTYTSSDPEPMYGNNTWVLDPLEPFGSQEIHIRGIIEGDDDDSRVFSASLGSQDKSDPRRLETVYSRTEEFVAIKKPFVGMKVLINKQSAEEPIVIDGKREIEVLVEWVNNLDNKVIDVGLEVRIDHGIVDRSTITMHESKGYYRSIDDVVIWDQRTNPELAVVMPGATGIVGFSFDLGSIVDPVGELYKDVEISIEATAKGRRLSNFNVPEQVKTPAVGKIRLLSSLDLASEVSYDDGPFSNTGPIPPKVNNETTYTVTWQLTNGTSDIKNTVVKTTLPTYVTWKGFVSPNSESVMYNELGGEVVWNAGDVSAGVGVVNFPREVSFKVGFIPSVTQVGSSPSLINDMTVTAVDDFTNSVISDSMNAMTISSLIESTFDPGADGKVYR